MVLINNFRMLNTTVDCDIIFGLGYHYDFKVSSATIEDKCSILVKAF